MFSVGHHTIGTSHLGHHTIGTSHYTYRIIWNPLTDLIFLPKGQKVKLCIKSYFPTDYPLTTNNKFLINRDKNNDKRKLVTSL